MTPAQRRSVYKYSSSPKGRYASHKSNAKLRGIPFNITFEEWWSLWEPHWHQRGRSSDSYQMCRKGDKGAYEVGNVYMATLATNRRDTKCFSEGEATAIRTLYAAGTWSQEAIAKAYGVAASTINYVVNKRGVYA